MQGAFADRLQSEVYIVQLFQRGGVGGLKPVPLVKIREENLYLMDFSYFTHENLVTLKKTA